MKKPRKFNIAQLEEMAKKMKVNKKLDKYEKVVLFPKKLEWANEVIKKIKLPE